MATRLVHGVMTTRLVTLSARPAPPAPLGRKGSSVVATRLPADAAARFIALARSNGTTPGQLLRTLVLASSSDPSAKTIAAIAQLVGLPEDALPSEVVSAVQALAAELALPDPASADPLDGGDVAPPPPVALSAHELAAAEQIKDPNKKAAFIALRKQRAAERAAGTKPTRK